VAGEQFLRDDDLTRSLAEFREAIHQAPHVAVAYQRAGYILLELSRHDEADALLQQGLQVAPGNIGIHLQLGRLYAARPSLPGALDKAEEHYLQALESNPNVAEVYAALGTLARQQGRATDAERFWRQALQANRNESAALYGLGQLLLAAGKRKEAEPLLQRYRLVQQFQREVADLRMKTAIRKSYDLRLRLARMAMDAGNYEEADRQLTPLLRERPDDPQIRSLMGELCLALQRPEDAQMEFRVASALPPK
jgi:tetratricopeptide (TPR) repeat protein